ncbi:putative Pyridoxal-phosphate dependent enzyme [Phycicoccus elongatus Lp2]|uniref:Putative Pyridoxal-phosphate dependent enzyme n=1 Tax=Phycicoccus elongatus Lp2 TaxID=1193181 RepID=N0E643_9MICO|nr:pyridoxal-phosphate dependent enzyme [Phycicoccus elongatus]CCH71004.1 putative Pyridoxal-phosphate dependent enzyme [Phycicoccus elongatus Lp2]
MTDPIVRSAALIDPHASAEALLGSVVRTSIRRLTWLERIVGVPVWAKLELQQHTGSFKYRGARLALMRGPDSPVIAASAGNHGLAVAQVASELGKSANICIPVNASRVKRDRILATGAGLIEHGSSMEEATAHAEALAHSSDLYYISPYNNPDVISGSSTIALEMLADVPDLTAMVAPVGGGGLFCGLALGSVAAGAQLRMFGTEPAAYASMSASMSAGEIVRVPHRPTLADGLAINLERDSITYNLAQQHLSGIVELTEEELAAGTLALLVHESLLVEPAGAASVIACLRLAQRGDLTGPVGIPLCGGNIQQPTLARIQRYSFQDPDLVRLLHLRGRVVSDIPVARMRQVTSLTATVESAGPAAELLEQVRSCMQRLQLTLRGVSDYVSYCADADLIVDQDVWRQVATAGQLALELLEREERVLAKAAAAAGVDELARTELLVRFGLATLAHVRGALEWCSPAYTQSRVAQFFDLAGQESPTVNYDRYESSSVHQVEDQLLRVLRLPPELWGVTVTSSGMAAYSLIESFLLRERLRPGDTVLLAPYIYFEAAEQVTSLCSVRCVRADGYGVEEILASVRRHRPRCIFIDPVANTAYQQMVDIPAVLARLREEAGERMTVVIDGTMLSAAMPPAALTSDDRLEVLYYESCSKYLQLGLDAAMAGFVAAPVSTRAHLERLRRNTGSILYRHSADLFPRYDSDMFRDRMARICSNATIVAERLCARPEVLDVVQVFYPGHPSHPDHQIAARLPYAGGCVTMLFREAGRNHRDLLEGVQEVVLAHARAAGLHLTKGVSFGFSTPRISAASSMAETEAPFLRLYVGDREAQVELLAEVVGNALVR